MFKKLLRALSPSYHGHQKWLMQPRLLPDMAKNMPPLNDDFIMSRELYCVDQPFHRQYAAAVFDKYRQLWKPVTCIQTRDGFETTEGCYIDDSAYYGHDLETPLDVVCFMREWEKHDHYIAESYPGGISFKKYKWEPVAGTNENYMAFASRRGVQFDVHGKPFMADKDKTLHMNTFLQGRGLVDVFKQENQTKIDMCKSWDGLAKMFRPHSCPSWVCEDAIKHDYARKLVPFLQKLDSFASDIRHYHSGLYRREIDALLDLKQHDFTEWSDDITSREMQHSQLYVLLNTGARIYANLQGKSLERVSDDRLLLKHIGDAAHDFAIARLSLSERQAMALKEVMMTGPNPDETLPLQIFLQEIEKRRVCPSLPMDIAGKQKKTP